MLDIEVRVDILVNLCYVDSCYQDYSIIIFGMKALGEYHAGAYLVRIPNIMLSSKILITKR